MRVTDRSSGHRTFTADVASKSHKAAILPDSLHESKDVSSLQYFKGVGPARAELLATMGLRSLADLAFYFPRAWEDRRVKFSIKDAPMGEKIALKATLKSVDFSETKSRLGMAIAELDDGTGELDAVWFKRLNPRYDVFSGLRRQLQPDQHLYVWGAIEWGPDGKQLRVDDFSIATGADGKLENDETFHFERIVPLYTVPENMSDRFVRTLVGRALIDKNYHAGDLLPESMRKQKGWENRAWAIRHLHFPASLLEKERAREMLAFEEFLILETALGHVRQRVKAEEKSHRYELRRHLLTPFRAGLGFEFTAPQKRVIREIFDDLMRPSPMSRLLQGDVGSGKTVIALAAMLLAVENGGQAALMAPTEILAEQHALVFERFLKGLPVRIAVLSGRHTPTQKKKVLEEVAAGRVDLLIGTHAIIQKRVRFQRLTLAVIDEQHRFGVEHRSLLREKGGMPDLLVMTATPIPRTLALTLYGDLDVSTLEGLPPGRSPITTLHVTEEDAIRRIRQAVSAGRQAYVVYPLVSESDKLELKAAVQEATRLQKTVFPDLRVGVLHGQLSARDKESIMETFRAGRIDILIATSIIEVGIDVPNATVMAVQHAERFGLSTLHQLRGRVGRGAHASSCLLIADARGDDARRRIEIMTQTTNGFVLSEEDLALRGPGEVLGAMQHGMPLFRIGHLIRDAHIIQESRMAAEALLKADPELRHPEHAALKEAVRVQYGTKWSLTA